MRFSFWPNASQTWTDILKLSQYAEAVGFDGLWVADHFMPNTEDRVGPTHEVWTLVSALGALVPRVRIGPLVLGNTYRHPAVVANMAASADHVTDGRLVLGIGAGWQENEHTAYGLDYFTVGGRLRRFEEACAVIRGLLREQRSTFDGRFYQLSDAPLEPKPLQSHLPIMIGGGGEKVTLKIVAKYADEWNIWGSVDTFRHKNSILNQHMETLGRAASDVGRSVAALVHLSDDAALIKKINDEPQPRATIAGDANQLVDIVGAYQDLGLTELIVPDFHFGTGATREKMDFMARFIEEVARKF